MNEIGDKLLPIGTVAMLKGGTKRVMITGYYSVEANNMSKIWDYSGCMFPEGFLSSTQTALFDHAQIEKIYHTGLIDEETEAFQEKLQEIMKNKDQLTKGIENSLEIDIPKVDGE